MNSLVCIYHFPTGLQQEGVLGGLRGQTHMIKANKVENKPFIEYYLSLGPEGQGFEPEAADCVLINKALLEAICAHLFLYCP